MWQSLVAALSSFEPMEWLTIGLVLFAGVQAIVQVRTENQRKQERKTDRERSDDLAFQLAWAEQFRIDALAEEWDETETDLVSLSCLGVLNPSDSRWSSGMAPTDLPKLRLADQLSLQTSWERSYQTRIKYCVRVGSVLQAARRAPMRRKPALFSGA